MKRFFAISVAAAVIAAAGVMCAGCDDDNLKGGDGGNGRNVIGNSGLTEVSGTLVNAVQLGDGDWSVRLGVWIDADEQSQQGQFMILEEAPIAADGSFTLQLPSMMNTKYMFSLSYVMGDMEWVNISDRNALMTETSLLLYSSDNHVGYVEYAGSISNTDGDAEGNLTFVSDDVTVSGSDSFEDEYGSGYRYVYDLSLKRGWNWFYMMGEYLENENVMTITTTPPAGGELFFYGSVYGGGGNY
jgi:hypothetical protein